MNIKKYSKYLFPLFLLSAVLIFRVTMVADNLGGKFFPKASPFLAGFYPNDFLPWGVILFFSAGWLSASYLIKLKIEKQEYFILILFLIYLLFGGFEFYLVHVYQKSGDYLDHWAYPWSELIGVWAMAWFTGSLFVFAISQLENKKEKVNS